MRWDEFSRGSTRLSLSLRVSRLFFSA